MSTHPSEREGSKGGWRGVCVCVWGGGGGGGGENK